MGFDTAEEHHEAVLLTVDGEREAIAEETQDILAQLTMLDEAIARGKSGFGSQYGTIRSHRNSSKCPALD